MSPQPTTPTAASNGADQEPVLHAALLKAIGDKDPKDRTSGEKQVFRALTLERERGELTKRIAANREYLRLMEENEELTDEQADWLEDFYPMKERGQSRSEDEIERTRKAKAAARS